MLYLHEDRLQDCKRLFRVFAKHHSPKRTALGFAGLALIASRSGDFAESQRIIDQDLPDFYFYLTADVRLLINEAKINNQARLQQSATG